jgi:hypothetical protein
VGALGSRDSGDAASVRLRRHDGLVRVGVSDAVVEAGGWIDRCVLLVRGGGDGGGGGGDRAGHGVGSSVEFHPGEDHGTMRQPDRGVDRRRENRWWRTTIGWTWR